MNLTFDDYVKELGLETLEKSDQIDALYKISKNLHTQFLLELSKDLDNEKMEAIKTSIRLGPELYVTTLKHLVPNYMEIFEKVKSNVFLQIKTA